MCVACGKRGILSNWFPIFFSKKKLTEFLSARFAVKRFYFQMRKQMRLKSARLLIGITTGAARVGFVLGMFFLNVIEITVCVLFTQVTNSFHKFQTLLGEICELEILRGNMFCILTTVPKVDFSVCLKINRKRLIEKLRNNKHVKLTL
jgi:hypothetical protein